MARTAADGYKYWSMRIVPTGTGEWLGLGIRWRTEQELRQQLVNMVTNFYNGNEAEPGEGVMAERLKGFDAAWHPGDCCAHAYVTRFVRFLDTKDVWYGQLAFHPVSDFEYPCGPCDECKDGFDEEREALLREVCCTGLPCAVMQKQE